MSIKLVKASVRPLRSLLVLAALGLGAQAKAAEVLTLSSWIPPSNPLVTDAIAPWAAEVEKVTEGRVRVRILPSSLGAPRQAFDVVRTGQVDISYGVEGYTPGRFTLHRIAEFPFMGDSSVERSTAYWKVYKQHLEKANEYAGVKVLSVYAHGPGHIYHRAKPVDSVEAATGALMRTTGGVAADVAQRIGVNPLLQPATEIYQMLSTGVADGVFFTHGSIIDYNLAGSVKHATEIPGGLYSATFYLIANERAFGRLSKQDQEAIMSISGPEFGRRIGGVWDKTDANGRALLEENGITLIQASDEFVAEIRERVQPMVEAWKKDAADKGIDADAALADFRRYLDESATR